jgi:hypothetical protein
MGARIFTRESWLLGIMCRVEPVGECLEWTGPYFKSVPLLYCPLDFVFPGSAQERRSVRMTLWALRNGERPPLGQIIRPSCLNDRCVAHEHWLVLDRKTQAREQAKRGELQTHKAQAAKMRTRRASPGAKLTQAKVDAIRTSGLSAKVEAAKYGVAAESINAIRRNAMWANTVPAASVFSWRGE